MTSLLDTIERRGLVRRLPHPEDRRKLLVELTESARALVDQFLPGVHALEREAMAGLTEQEQEQLVRLLGKVLRHVPQLADRQLTSRRRRRPTPASRQGS